MRPTHEDSIDREPARSHIGRLNALLCRLGFDPTIDRNAIPLPEAIVMIVGEVTTTAGAVRGDANVPVGMPVPL